MNPIINMVVRRLANALLRWFMRRQGVGGGMGPRGGGRKRGGRRF